MSDINGKYGPETLFLVDALNMIEALGNLTHLIEADARDGEAVHSYVTQADQILRRLATLVRSRSLSDHRGGQLVATHRQQPAAVASASESDAALENGAH